MGENLEIYKSKIDIVVLMAGEGKRMRPLTVDRPKALISCEDGLSIFNHLVNSFAATKLNINIIPVIGHGANMVHKEIKKLSNLADFNCIYNPFYNSSGPIISLLLGLLQSKNENIVVVNGDTLIKNTLTNKVSFWFNDNVVHRHAGLCVSSSKIFSSDDMKVALDYNGFFNEVGKNIKSNDTSFKSAGVFCIKGAYSKQVLMDRLQSILTDNRTLKTNYHWHNMVNEIKDLMSIDLIEVDLDSWYEIDTPEELNILNVQ